TRSEAIWQRFRGACDRFFARYAQRHDIARAERVAAREAICAELEALQSQESRVESSQSRVESPESNVESQASTVESQESTVESPPADLVARVRDIRRRWQQEVAARGVDRERALALDQRFQSAFDELLMRFPTAFAGTDL